VIEENYTNEEGKVILSFKSSYTIEGNKVKVIIEEFYKQTQYPAEIFNEYRSVVNAAADFEKISLIFEKI